MTYQDEVASNIVVEDIAVLYYSRAHILFDPRATHSFIRINYAMILGLNFDTLEKEFSVSLPTMETVEYK